MSDAWLSVCSCLNICINERRGQKTTRSLSSPTHPTPFFLFPSLLPSLPPWALSSLLLITGCPLWLSAWMCSVRWSKSSSVSSPALPLALCMRVWENVCVSFSYEPSTQSSKPSLSLSSFSLSSTFPGSLASSPCLLEGTHTHTHMRLYKHKSTVMLIRYDISHFSVLTFMHCWSQKRPLSVTLGKPKFIHSTQRSCACTPVCLLAAGH